MIMPIAYYFNMLYFIFQYKITPNLSHNKAQTTGVMLQHLNG